MGGKKNVKNRRTSFMDDPLHKIGLHDSEMYLFRFSNPWGQAVIIWMA